MPGLGLVVRERSDRRLQVFATPDTIAMAAMCPVRVAWMAAVARGVLRRQSSQGRSGAATATGSSGRSKRTRVRTTV